jgi:sugar diacid utilization regulator
LKTLLVADGGVWPDAVADGEAEELRRRLHIEVALSDVRAREPSLSALIRTAAEVLGSAVFLVDPSGRVVASAGASEAGVSSIPTLPRLLEAANALASAQQPVVLVPALRDAAFTRRHLLAPVALDGHLFAWLVVKECADRPLEADRWAAERAALHLAGEFASQRRLARVAWNARANLGRQMVRSTSYDEDLRACAEYLGVDLDVDRVVVFVLERERPSISTVDAGRLSDLVSARSGADVLPIRGSEGVVLAVAATCGGDKAEVVRNVKRAVVHSLQTMGEECAVAGISSVTRPGQLRRAYREAREAARCLDRYAPGKTCAVACDELGPARLFVANTDEHAVRTYVRDVLGPLLDGGAAMVELLRTLQCFFDAGRSVRETAHLLRVHENTVRHRLARVHDLTGLDVASGSNDQLSVHTALLVLRLQGHHAVPGLDG